MSKETMIPNDMLTRPVVSEFFLPIVRYDNAQLNIIPRLPPEHSFLKLCDDLDQMQKMIVGKKTKFCAILMQFHILKQHQQQ